MLYNDLTITIAARQGLGYPLTASGPGLGHVSSALPPIDPTLEQRLGRLAGLAEQYPLGRPGDSAVVREAGNALFRWLFAGALETHFRLAWDRAARAGRGLRLRLSIDAPEIASLPWELLHDPARDHAFAAAAATPLVRFFDQADTFGGLAEPEAQLPLAMLLVLPAARELDLAKERDLVHEATASLRGALNLHVLEGAVTRTALAETLQAAPFDILHFAGHGGRLDGQSYIRLTTPDGKADWADPATFARLLDGTHPVKLVVLNACSLGQVAANRPFSGFAPQLVRADTPAVVAMQYVLADQAALDFAREFYRQLSVGRDAGQVNVALAHARNMLAALHPESLAFAAPVLYTHAAEGVIFRLPADGSALAEGDPAGESARLAMFMGSLQASRDFADDWDSG